LPRFAPFQRGCALLGAWHSFVARIGDALHLPCCNPFTYVFSSQPPAPAHGAREPGAGALCALSAAEHSIRHGGRGRRRRDAFAGAHAIELQRRRRRQQPPAPGQSDACCPGGPPLRHPPNTAAAGAELYAAHSAQAVLWTGASLQHKGAAAPHKRASPECLYLLPAHHQPPPHTHTPRTRTHRKRSRTQRGRPTRTLSCRRSPTAMTPSAARRALRSAAARSSASPSRARSCASPRCAAGQGRGRNGGGVWGQERSVQLPCWRAAAVLARSFHALLRNQGAACTSRPQILLLDEATSALDADRCAGGPGPGGVRKPPPTPPPTSRFDLEMYKTHY
jgi:hypothetical protein